MATPGKAPAQQRVTQVRHRPEHTLLYQIVEEHYPTFRDLLEQQVLTLKQYFSRLHWIYAIKYFALNKARSLISAESRITHAQLAEDVILNILCNAKNKDDGFYIDVGCNKPVRFSNTFFFYLRGWSGICIDGNSVLTEEFKRVRKKDCVVNAIVSDEEKNVTFHVSRQYHEISTIDLETKNKHSKRWDYDYSVELPTKRLDSILQEQGLTAESNIDFLTIDLEGHDFEALKSIDLKIYRPKIILIETHDQSTKEDIGNYLEPLNYRVLFSVGWNTYYQKKKE